MRLWLGQRARPLGGDAAPRTAATIRPLVAGAAGLLVSVILLAAWIVSDARRVELDHATNFSHNLVSAIGHDIGRTIALYDLSLKAVIDGLNTAGIDTLDPALRDQVLFDHATEAEYLGALMVLDETGRITSASRHPPLPDQNFADRDFFRVQRAGTGVGLYISTPFEAQPGGNAVIALSRRLEHRDGSFAGIVFGTLQLDFFVRLFARIDTGPGSSIALFRSDGSLLYRAPSDGGVTGDRRVEASILEHTLAAPKGTFAATSELDHVERLYAYRRFANLPLVLSAGLARDTVLREWRLKAAEIAAAMLVLSALVGLLGWALVRELRRRGAAEQATRESEQRYRLLAEHSADMIVRFDPFTQRRTYISPASRRLYGYEPEEALARSAEEIIHPDDLAAVLDAVARLEHDEQPPVLYRGRRKDGSYIWVEASLTWSHDPATGAAEIVSVVRDASERIRYETALRQAKDEADSANHSKSRFLATISHELRTPLNAIIGFAEIMQHELMGPITNDHYRSYVTDIHQSGTHLLQLINDILDLTKAEAGKLELNEEIFDVAEVIRSVARLSRAPVEKAGLIVTIDVPDELPALRADERKTRQVLFNLIGNAIKFTHAGGSIDLRARFNAQSGMRIAVTDSGIGIAPENLQRVLEPFVQVDSSLSRLHAGTGLGLPAVKAMMELHGGTLELRSIVGTGTEAAVIFPPERAVHQSRKKAPRSAA